MQSTFDMIRAHARQVSREAHEGKMNLFLDEPVLKWERNGGQLLRETVVRQTPQKAWRSGENQFYLSNTGQIHSTFFNPEDIEWQHGNS